MVAGPLSSQHADGGHFSASWKNARILPVFAAELAEKGLQNGKTLCRVHG
jgi:hypothetical protein